MLNRLIQIGISERLIKASGITESEAHDLLEMLDKQQLTKKDILEELREQSDEYSNSNIGPNGYEAIGNDPWALTEYFSIDEIDSWE